MKNYILQILKYCTLPLALLYGLIIWIRNGFYNSGLSSSLKFQIPIISFGNLSVGGTGKTPHTEFLIELLKDKFHLATLSRGYKRRTQGFILANEESTALQIGDEPMQFNEKYPSVDVCVCEDRIMAVPQLMQKIPQLQVILLDDAFQHRSIQPGINVLITDVNHLYSNDYILPFGRLREFRKGANRADIIIVSKCNEQLTLQESEAITTSLNKNKQQEIFFTSLYYKPSYSWFTKQVVDVCNASLLVISGIANPDHLLNKIRTFTKTFHYMGYQDHYYFTMINVEEMIEAYSNLQGEKKYLLTTEKDATRLALHKDMFVNANIDVIVLPIQIKFLFDGQHQFNQIIEQYLLQYYPPILEEESVEQKIQE